MAAKHDGMKTAAIETHERGPMGETYRKSSDGLETNAQGTGSLDMAGERRVGDDEVDPEILAHGLEALEGKKKAWYSYFTTRDFWIVLALGYKYISHILFQLLTIIVDKFWPFASPVPIPSRLCWSTKALRFLLSRLSSTTSCLRSSTLRTRYTNMDSRSISRSCWLMDGSMLF